VALFRLHLTHYDIDGSILELSELDALIEKIEMTVSVKDLLEFTQSRIRIANRNLPDKTYLENNILHWLCPSQINDSEIGDFELLCKLAVENRTFFCYHWLPKIIVRINSSTQHIVSFIKEYPFPQEQDKQLDLFCSIARFISIFYGRNEFVTILDTVFCKIETIEHLKRNEREKVFWCLTPHSTPVMITPTGEVNAYYDDQKTLAKMMRESIVNWSSASENGTVYVSENVIECPKFACT
jgi:hypothetical protein